MKTRIIALVLCALMLIPMFASCSNEVVESYMQMYFSHQVYDLDPLNAYTNDAQLKIVSLIFSGLYKINEKGKVTKDLVAKEEVVGVFGTLSNMEDLLGSVEAGDAAAAITAGKMFFSSALAGFSFLVFNLLCAPCFAAMGAIKREMNDGRWTAFAIGYMCVFAYAISLMIYQFGAWAIGAGSVVGTILASLVVVFLVYMLVRKNKYIKIKE